MRVFATLAAGFLTAFTTAGCSDQWECDHGLSDNPDCIPSPPEPSAEVYSGPAVAWTGTEYRLVYTRTDAGRPSLETAAVRSFSDGGNVGPRQPLIVDGDVVAGSEAYIAARDDGYLIAWRGTYNAVEAAWFSPDGSDHQRVPFPVFSGWVVGVAADAGGYLVLWHDFVDELLYVTPIAPDGSSIGDDVAIGPYVPTYSSDPTPMPTIASTGEGFAVAWSTGADAGDLVVARLASDGTVLDGTVYLFESDGLRWLSPLAVRDGEYRLFYGLEPPGGAAVVMDLHLADDGSVGSEPSAFDGQIVGLVGGADGLLAITFVSDNGVQLSARYTNALDATTTVDLGLGGWDFPVAAASGPDRTFLLGFDVETVDIEDRGIDIAHIALAEPDVETRRTEIARNVDEDSAVGCAASTPGTSLAPLLLVALFALRASRRRRPG